MDVCSYNAIFVALQVQVQLGSGETIILFHIIFDHFKNIENVYRYISFISTHNSLKSVLMIIM